MTQAFYRKWRPAKWDQVVGQQHVVQPLRNAVAVGKQGHAYLFAGPRGTGKTTVARILAKAVNCLEDNLTSRPCDQCAHCQAVRTGNFLDLIEIDAASNTSVEDVRDLRDKINFSPNQGRYKVYLIDEVHMLSTAAFNALLKTLEEPPPHAIFVLATTEVHKIPATVLSRCQRHEFRRIPVVEIVSHLKEMAEGEGLSVDPDVLHLVARQATGSLRDAISLLDQLSTLGEEVSLDSAQAVLGTATSQSVIDLIEAILEDDSGKAMDSLHTSLDAGSDPRQFARQVVEYLRGVMLVRMGNADMVDTTNEARQHMARHAQAFDGSNELLRVIRAFNTAATGSRGAWQPSLPLEMAIMESVLAADAPPKMPVNPPSSKNPPVPIAQTPSTAPDTEKQAAHKEAESKQPARQGLGKQWEQILQLLKKTSPNTTGLLNAKICQYSWENGILSLYYGSSVLKEKMEQEQHIEALQKIAEQVLGEEVEVQCFVSGGGGGLPPGVDSAGRVAAAMRLGGKIVDVNELASGVEPDEE
jgi:DNA polymerase-3 subunit gamma/tau